VIDGSPAGRPASTALARWKSWLPWLAGLLILVVLFGRVPPRQVLASLAEGPTALLAAYAAVFVLVALLADGAATRVAFQVAGVPYPLPRVILARGASYLLGLVSYSLGQAALGVFLYRRGATASRATGAVLLGIGANITALLLIVSAGAIADPALSVRAAILPWLLAGAAGTCIYLALVALRPRGLARIRHLRPFLEAGPAGFARAVAARLPHFLVMVAGLWGALRLWGVPVPFGRGLLLLPLVLLISALPITPSGLGSVQAALIVLFRHLAPEESLLAFGILFHFYGLVIQAAVGAACLAWLSRHRAPPAAGGERLPSARG
jgi:uncharacterized membrane protein YbhN (UPF0104 family)